MLLDELKILIKDFETVLSNDTRFKKDMYFKNQVKIIYGHKQEPKNVFIPVIMQPNNQEINKLKERIIYLEKTYEKGEIEDTDEITKKYTDLRKRAETTSSEEEDIVELYKNPHMLDLTLSEQINFLKEVDYKKFGKYSYDQIKEMIKPFQKK